MRAPGFWWRRRSVRSWVLAPLGGLVGRVAVRRMRKPGEPPPVPVVCVGNFVVGGAGKTPTALTLGRLAIEAGHRPAFLTRGHGGRLKGPLLVDPDRHGADAVGDEALLLGRRAPTVVARDRAAGVRLAAERGADLVIMDDGFQNPSIVKTLSLVVVDGVVGVGTGRVMPAGPLRAPLSEQFPRADAVVVIGEGPAGRDFVRMAAKAGKPVLHARLVSRNLADWRGRRVFAFAGIGRPEKFYETLAAGGVEIVATRNFPDHHPYTGLEAAEIMTAADRLGAAILTTEKDAIRLVHAGPGPRAELLARAGVIGVDCVFEDPARVMYLVEEARRGWLIGR